MATKQPETMVVVAPDGTRGLAVIRAADPSAVLVRWEDGKEESLPSAWLTPRGDGWFALGKPGEQPAQPVAAAAAPLDASRQAPLPRGPVQTPLSPQGPPAPIARSGQPPVAQAQAGNAAVGRDSMPIPLTNAVGAQQATVVPVIEERLEVEKRLEEAGRVRVVKEVAQHEEVIDEPLVREVVQVERVPVGRTIHEAPGIREEGDTMIVPVVEEQIVVEKRLVLKEEIRITRRRVTERPEPKRVALRQERVRVERVDQQERRAR